MAEINELIGAIRSFHADHEYYPVPTNKQAKAEFKDMLPVLLALPESAEARRLNPEMVVYINVNLGRCHDGKWFDPWGSPYHLALTTNAVPKLLIGEGIVSENVAVWSNGPNKKDDQGNGDDICSWKIPDADHPRRSGTGDVSGHRDK